METKPNILEVLKKRPIIGDGSYVLTLEKRGYVKAGAFSPEAVLEYPDAVKQLHKDYRRAGSDVLQVFTFFATDVTLKKLETTNMYTSDQINQAACSIMKEVADPGVYVCGGISPVRGENEPKKIAQNAFRKQIEVFRKNKVDLVLGEFFGHVEEAEWAIEVMKELGVPVACTIRVGPTGDMDDVSPGDCAVRMAKAGADILGINCQFDINTCLKTIKMMKEGLDKEDLHPVLMIQPLGFLCPEAENWKRGYHELPEYPFCLEPRLLTRYDCRRFAREAYNLGVRYIGGCCGIEPYHIREMAEELSPEIGHRPPGHDKNGEFGNLLHYGGTPSVRERVGRDYWMNVIPATGRPNNPTTSESHAKTLEKQIQA